MKYLTFSQACSLTVETIPGYPDTLPVVTCLISYLGDCEIGCPSS